LPRSPLKTSLRVLTDAFADSVMEAIRAASLEEVMGADREARRPTEVGRATRPTRPRSKAKVRRVSGARSSRSAAKIDEGDSALLEPTSEITDPQMLLGLGLIDPVIEPPPRRFEATNEPKVGLHANASAPVVRLRENESVARVSSGGVVIRRAR
jgi:hypothetical protein